LRPFMQTVDYVDNVDKSGRYPNKCNKTVDSVDYVDYYLINSTPCFLNSNWKASSLNSLLL
jgi:hypothetical protein